MNFQEIILTLERYWAEQGCIIAQPYDVEKGAGTFNPATTLRCLGPEPWRVAYVEPSRRPTDSRYGDNPIRFYLHHQYQVIVKPVPDDPQGIYLESLRRLGIDLRLHDVRFVEDDWESPTLGASGLGWQVWLDGIEITQFTYFQQMASIELDPPSLELTYGLERIAVFIQKKDNAFDLQWVDGFTYGDVRHQDEVQFSRYCLDEADVQLHLRLFDLYEAECLRLVDKALPLPAYDYVLKCSHTFNILDSRGAIGVAQRTAYIARVRKLARAVGEAYLASRKTLGWPLLRNAAAAGAATDKAPSAQSTNPSESQ